jgi:hypothetical protein
VVGNFETAVRGANEKKGYIFAYSFVKSAHEEAARAKNQDGIEITLLTVQKMKDAKAEETTHTWHKTHKKTVKKIDKFRSL